MVRSLLVFSVIFFGCSKDLPSDSGVAVQGDPSHQQSPDAGESNSEAPLDESGVSGEDDAGESFSGDAGDFVTAVSSAICDAMFRCCDGNSHEWFFQAWRDNALVSDRVAEMPPNMLLNVESCPALVADLMVETWLGGWMSTVSDGMVELDLLQAGNCLDELRNATCGDPLRAALTDRTCFSVSAPSGGLEQRRFVRRTSIEGADCRPIGDGFGGLYYGSCDSTRAFCCVPDETGSCSAYPVVGDVGTCQAITPDGESCSQEPPLQMCQTGPSCVEGVCVPNATAPLSVGEVCYEQSTYSLLGECDEGWCDLFGSQECESPKAESEPCFMADECDSDWCDPSTQTCVLNPICNG